MAVVSVIAFGSLYAVISSVPAGAIRFDALGLAMAVCVLVADLLPISLERYGLRLSMGLPFLAGIFVHNGPFAALVVSVTAALASSLMLAAQTRQKLQSRWLILNLLSALACVGCGVLATNWVAQIQPYVAMKAWEIALDFSLVHCLVNVSLVAMLRGNLIGQKITGEDRSSFAALHTILALYLAAGTGVSILVASRQPWLFLAMVPPLAMLRAAIQQRVTMLEHYYETVVALMIMLQRAHPYTHGHLERVARLAERVALRLGLSSSRARLVRDAAILHDVGKIAIDEEILDKPGRLTEEEFDHVKHHSAFGASILEPCDHFRELVPWIRHHHERPDGRGYPDGLTDRAIPLESKIIAVVDAFDAMVGGSAPGSQRTYREPMDVREALVELDRCSDTQFDRAVVTAFREVLLEGSV